LKLKRYFETFKGIYFGLAKIKVLMKYKNPTMEKTMKSKRKKS
jgi:hypothetical protein